MTFLERLESFITKKYTLALPSFSVFFGLRTGLNVGTLKNNSASNNSQGSKYVLGERTTF